MNAGCFDTLTRSLTATPSRRGVARALAGLSLAVVLAPLRGITDIEARKKKKRKGKKKGRNKTSPPPPPQPPTCTNTATDPRNCGTCGKRCQVNATCDVGTCSCGGPCGDPNTSCAEAATNTCACAASGNPSGRFFDPGIPDFITDCPANRQCIGPECQACCPTGSTCDPYTGTCLQ